MILETAKKLLFYTNQDAFQDAIAAYVTERINNLHQNLEVTSDYETTRYYQGCINELQRLSRLRQDVIAVTKLARK
jgi:hypothetical protein